MSDGQRPDDRSPLQRAFAPGSHTSTASGVFLAYGGPLIATLGVIALVAGDALAGIVMLGLGSLLTITGHTIARR